MKTVLLSVFALCMSLPAMADVVLKPSAADSSACTTPIQKQQLRDYYHARNGKKPSCLKLGAIKASSAAVNNCKTSFQKSDLTKYLTGKMMTPPKCYTPAKFVYRARSSASCSHWDRNIVRRIQHGKEDVMTKYPACYK